MKRNIDDVVESIKNAENGCAILVGAGCSVKAGIPTADEFVEIIKEDYKEAYAKAEMKDYPGCMAALAPDVRNKLINKYIDEAKINWAHIAIAQLMKNGYIKRVLTTNFDPLVVKACALVGLFPAVYDFAASQFYKSEDISEPAIFYLHGQRTGFIRKNTPSECKKHSKSLNCIFEDTRKKRTWLVVGYSGKCDPVFDDHLAKVKEFGSCLYWVTYRNDGPPKHVSECLLHKDKYAYYVEGPDKGYDADDFFVILAQKLGCFPPNLIEKPFTHIREIIEMLTPYTIPGQDSEKDVREETIELIDKAIVKFENTIEQKTTAALMEGDYDRVIDIVNDVEIDMSPVLADTVAWAYVMQGVDIHEKATLKQGMDADELYEHAIQKYKQAVDIKPDFHEAINNWGAVFANWANNKQGEEADKLYQLAIQKYEQAVDIKSDDHEAIYNWGLALYNWANNKQGRDADKLYELAVKKYEHALEINPDKHKTLNNWGAALSNWASNKQGEEADKLYQLAIQKYEQATEIKPDNHKAPYNCGLAFYNWASNKQGEEADKLYQLAIQKYEYAVEIKPDDYDALNNWGLAIMCKALNGKGNEREKLLIDALDKYIQAEAILPGITAYNIACLYAIQNDEINCQKWLDIALEHNTLPSREHLENDSDLDLMRDKDWFKEFLAKL